MFLKKNGQKQKKEIKKVLDNLNLDAQNDESGFIIKSNPYYNKGVKCLYLDIRIKKNYILFFDPFGRQISGIDIKINPTASSIKDDILNIFGVINPNMLYKKGEI